ncbi:hypothetical protein J4399_04690 [Candidatus Woesearchaeota archaeon]|nr:hypothetical protein [Candidatus Woesearchaeota archaeon]HIJ13695.1 hypothetical protein [Candidatus Woesearchaeota archaeon]
MEETKIEGLLRNSMPLGENFGKSPNYSKKHRLKMLGYIFDPDKKGRFIQVL